MGYSPWDGTESDMTEACAYTQEVAQGAVNLTDEMHGTQRSFG